jgi:repressor LexA
VLNAIIVSIDVHGYPPSIREIGDLAALRSTSSVSYVLGQLVAKGYLQRDERKPRALRVVTDEGAS